MAGSFPGPKQLEILSSVWQPKWDWSPQYMMFTSYWPDPACFIAYGTNGTRTLAVRGTWQGDLQRFLKLIEPMKVVVVRLSNYPKSDDVERVRPDADGPTGFLPPSVSTNPTDTGENETAGPISATLCITVPHWNAVTRAFERLLKGGPRPSVS